MMNFTGNVFWLISSWWIALLYLFGAIIFFPLFPFLWPIIGFVFLPFGRELVTPGYLQQFKVTNEASNANLAPNFSDTKGIIRTLANIIWPLTIGWILALAHILGGLLNILLGVCMIWTIIGLPIAIVNAKVHFSMVPKVFTPFGRIIISSEVANKLKDMKANKDIEGLTGQQ